VEKECCRCASRSRGAVMIWEVPTFVEIEMNAEIGSYQEDFDGI
jgi:hypothetical protein